MSNAKEYYNTHSQEYVAKWGSLDCEASQPAHWYRQQLIELVLDLAQVHSGQRVVEVGCGTGLVLRELFRRTPYVFGTDVSEEMLKRVQDTTLKDKRVTVVDSFLDTENGGDKILLMVDDLVQTKLPERYFDVIISVEVLRYIKDISAALAQLERIMESSSLLVFTITNFWSFSFFPLKFSLRRLLGLMKPQELQQYFVTEGAIRKRLAASGLRIVGWRRVGFLTMNPLLRRLVSTRRGYERMFRFEQKISSLPIFRKFFDTFIITTKRV